MLVWSIDDMFVYLIRYDIAVISDDDVRNLLKFLSSEDLAARIRRVAQHQSLGSLLEGIFNQVGIE